MLGNASINRPHIQRKLAKMDEREETALSNLFLILLNALLTPRMLSLEQSDKVSAFNFLWRRFTSVYRVGKVAKDGVQVVVEFYVKSWAGTNP